MPEKILYALLYYCAVSIEIMFVTDPTIGQAATMSQWSFWLHLPQLWDYRYVLPKVWGYHLRFS